MRFRTLLAAAALTVIMGAAAPAVANDRHHGHHGRGHHNWHQNSDRHHNRWQGGHHGWRDGRHSRGHDGRHHARWNRPWRDDHRRAHFYSRGYPVYGYGHYPYWNSYDRGCDRDYGWNWGW